MRLDTKKPIGARINNEVAIGQTVDCDVISTNPKLAIADPIAKIHNARTNTTLIRFRDFLITIKHKNKQIKVYTLNRVKKYKSINKNHSNTN